MKAEYVPQLVECWASIHEETCSIPSTLEAGNGGAYHRLFGTEFFFLGSWGWHYFP